jgi:hypothetical protein
MCGGSRRRDEIVMHRAEALLGRPMDVEQVFANDSHKLDSSTRLSVGNRR